MTKVIGVLAVIGLGIAGYLTYVHYAGIHVLCAASGGCETVQTSSYAKLAGIPVPVLGLIGYVGILVSLFIPGDPGRLATAGFALVGFGFSLYLTYLELFVIKAICQWCVGSAVIMPVIAVLSVVRLLRAPVVPASVGPT